DTIHLIYFTRLYREAQLCTTSAEFRERVGEEARYLCQRQLSPLPFEYLLETTDFDALDQLPREVLESYATAFPDAPLIPLARAVLAEAAEVPRDSVTAAGKALATLDTLDETVISALHLPLAVRTCFLVQADDYSGAIETAQRALGELHTYTTRSGSTFLRLQVWITLMQADSYRALGARYLPEAQQAYEAVLTLNSDSLPAQLGLATVLNSQGRFAQSVALLQTVTKRDPDNHLALAELGWVHFQNQAWEEAEGLIKRAITLQPHTAEYYFRLGRIYWEWGETYRSDKSLTLTAWLQAARLNPQLDKVFFWLGRFYEWEAQVNSNHPAPALAQRALKCYQRAFELNPRNNSDTAQQLIQLYAAEHQWTLVARVTQTVVQVNPRASWAWRIIAMDHLHRTGQYSEAITAFQQAIKTMPSAPKNTESSAAEGGRNTAVVVWEGLGKAYFRDGRYVASRRALERALELVEADVEPEAEPNSPSAVSIHWLLGRVFQELSEFPEALVHFDSALRLFKLLPRTTVPSSTGVFDAPTQPVTPSSIRATVEVARLQCLLLQGQEFLQFGYFGQVRMVATEVLVQSYSLLIRRPPVEEAGGEESGSDVEWVILERIHDACRLYLNVVHQSQAPTDGFVAAVGSVMDHILTTYPDLLPADCPEHDLAALYRSWRGVTVSDSSAASALTSSSPSPLDSAH
ncbi:Tetratricopeptide repeat protein 37, partial [Dimargaris cristalligena]